MEYRALGRTGVHVSKLCLGTMMFGAWGNTDHEDSVRIIHRALDAVVIPEGARNLAYFHVDEVRSGDS
jgi:predicted aldo/keto reductase-like oxidoreductase